jgi:GNAT superfamily N-acetyltransferase
MTAIPDNNVQVRLAGPEHINILVDFNLAMALETEKLELDAGVVRSGVDAVLAGKDLGFYVVAEYTGRPVGGLLITYEWSDWRNGYFWWIQSVYVSPTHRKLGVYRAMHRYVTLEARRRGGVCGLRLYVDKDNEVAQQVYASMRMRQAHYDMFELEFDQSAERQRPESGRE